MWKRGARACDREGDGSGPSVDRDREKLSSESKGGEGNTYTLTSHLR